MYEYEYTEQEGISHGVRPGHNRVDTGLPSAASVGGSGPYSSTFTEAPGVPETDPHSAARAGAKARHNHNTCVGSTKTVQVARYIRSVSISLIS